MPVFFFFHFVGVAGGISCNFSWCPIGTQKDASRDSSLACYKCRTGKFNVVDPTTSETYGSCKFCAKGRSFVDAISICTDCIAGMYQEQNVAQKDQTQKCKLCMSGFSSTKNAALCDYKPATCPPGTESKVKYTPVAGTLKKYTACLTCGGGKYTSVEGSVDCQYCTQGKHFATYQKECDFCAAGYYQNEINVPSATCKTCATGTASTLNTAVDFTCQYNSTSCPAGTYHNGDLKCIGCDRKNIYFFFPPVAIHLC